MYLFDTNILSEVVKKKPSSSLLERLRGTQPNLQYTSCITVMELRYGAKRKQDYEDFWQRIETEVLSMVTVLPIDAGTAFLAGDVAADLSMNGISVAVEDLLIGCTALHENMILITANTKHFERIPGLKIENWLI